MGTPLTLKRHSLEICLSHWLLILSGWLNTAVQYLKEPGSKLSQIVSFPSHAFTNTLTMTLYQYNHSDTSKAFFSPAKFAPLPHRFLVQAFPEEAPSLKLFPLISIALPWKRNWTMEYAQNVVNRGWARQQWKGREKLIKIDKTLM